MLQVNLLPDTTFRSRDSLLVHVSSLLPDDIQVMWLTLGTCVISTTRRHSGHLTHPWYVISTTWQHPGHVTHSWYTCHLYYQMTFRSRDSLLVHVSSLLPDDIQVTWLTLGTCVISTTRRRSGHLTHPWYVISTTWQHPGHVTQSWYTCHLLPDDIQVTRLTLGTCVISTARRRSGHVTHPWYTCSSPFIPLYNGQQTSPEVEQYPMKYTTSHIYHHKLLSCV